MTYAALSFDVCICNKTRAADVSSFLLHQQVELGIGKSDGRGRTAGKEARAWVGHAQARAASSVTEARGADGTCKQGQMTGGSR